MNTITTNCLPGSVKKRNLKTYFMTTLFCIVGYLCYYSADAQIPAQCGSPGCTSNDVRITKASITDVNGQFFVCTGTQAVDNAWLHLFVTTNTKRIGCFVALTVNVVTNGDTTHYYITHCFSGSSLNGVDNDLKVLLPSGAFICGGNVFLSGIYTAWGTGTSDFCSGSTGVVCQATPSKCRFVPGEILQVQTTPCSQPTNVTVAPSSSAKCVGDNTSFTVTFGNNQSATIQWEVSTNGGTTWTPLSGQTTATLNLSSVQASMNNNQYHAIVTNHTSDPLGTHDCPITSSAVTLTVYPTSVGGSVGSIQTICSGNQLNTDLTLSGQTGSIVKWQKSTDNFVLNVTDIANTSTTLSKATIGTLTQDMWFRAVVQSGICSSTNSSSVKITVNIPSVGGTVGSAQTVCNGTQPANDLSVTGITGTVVKWQKSTDNFATNSTDIANTATTLSKSTIGSLTQDTWFRAVIQSGVCPATNASSIKITVDAASIGGTAGSPQTICSGNQPANDLTVTGINGSVIKWQKSTDNFASNVTDISSSASSTLSKSTIGTLTQDTWFRTVVQNGTCSVAYSSAVKITVGAVPGTPLFTVIQPSLCGPPKGSITICQTVSGYDYTVGTTTLHGNGQSQSFTDLIAGSSPALTVINTTGNCSSAPFNCTDAAANCSSSGSTIRQSTQSLNVVVPEPTVSAFPNPFNDRVKFVVNAPIAGNGSLDVYNIMGQKVKSVYQGHINAGNNSFELTIPKKQQATLIYMFRVGDKKVTGKLLQLNN